MSEIQILGVCQIAIVVSNIEKGLEFYRDKLGLNFLFSVPPSLAFLDCNGIRIMLTLPELDKPEYNLTSSILYYKLSNIESAYETLLNKKVTFVDKPHKVAVLKDHELWLCFLKDLDGNTLALMEEKQTP